MFPLNMNLQITLLVCGMITLVTCVMRILYPNVLSFDVFSVRGMKLLQVFSHSMHGYVMPSCLICVCTLQQNGVDAAYSHLYHGYLNILFSRFFFRCIFRLCLSICTGVVALYSNTGPMGISYIIPFMCLRCLCILKLLFSFANKITLIALPFFNLMLTVQCTYISTDPKILYLLIGSFYFQHYII